MKKLLWILVLSLLWCNTGFADSLTNTKWEIKYDNGDIHEITFHGYKLVDGSNCERKDLLDTNSYFVGGCLWTLYKDNFKITFISGATPIRGEIVLFGTRIRGTYGKLKFTGKKIK